MSGNTNPIFPLTPNVGFGPVLTANTALDGTGTATLVFTAGANGARVDRAKVKYSGTSVATVLRFFLNNGSAQGVAANNSLITEATVPANTISQTLSSIDIEVPLNIVLPAGYKLYCTVGTAVAAALEVAVFGGDF